MTALQIGELVEWYDDDDETNRMGIVRAIMNREARVSGGSDPCADYERGVGWSSWVAIDDLKRVDR